MWRSMVLYFYVTAALGEWQIQDLGQNQQRSPVPLPTDLPVPTYDQKPALSPVFVGQAAPIPQARPCRRRNTAADPAVVFTESGWIPVQFPQATAAQTENQPFQPQILKPQSLTEKRAPTVYDRNQQAEPSNQKSEYPDKIVEYVEKSSLPNKISEKRNQDENENKKAAQDQKLNDNLMETAKVDSKSAAADKTGFEELVSDERTGSHEESLDCLDSHEQRSGNSETNDVVGRSAPKQVHKQAEDLLSKCIEQSRRSMSNLEEDLRKFEADSPTSLDLSETGAEIISKSKTGLKDNAQANLQRADTGSNKNSEDKSGVKEYLQNPALNAGKWNGGRQVSLLTNGKVCYACSTYHDPSCWDTNATTTVKYCNRDNNACLKKIYKVQGKTILIRDCGHTCNHDEGYMGKTMTSCSMCHTDMCNSAYAIHGLHALLVAFVTFTLKFTL